MDEERTQVEPEVRTQEPTPLSAIEESDALKLSEPEVDEEYRVMDVPLSANETREPPSETGSEAPISIVTETLLSTEKTAISEQGTIQETVRETIQETITVEGASLRAELARVQGELEQVRGTLEQLQGCFDGKLKYDQHKDVAIDQLHEEVMEYRRGLVERVAMQIAGDVISEIDDTRSLLSYYEKSPDSEYPKLLKTFVGLAERIEEDMRRILEKQDIFGWRSLPLSDFDPKRQRSLETIPTADPTQDRKIAESVRWGFEKDGKVIRPEMVKVYLFQAPVATTKIAEPSTEPAIDMEVKSDTESVAEPTPSAEPIAVNLEKADEKTIDILDTTPTE